MFLSVPEISERKVYLFSVIFQQSAAATNFKRCNIYFLEDLSRYHVQMFYRFQGWLWGRKHLYLPTKIKKSINKIVTKIHHVKMDELNILGSSTKIFVRG